MGSHALRTLLRLLLALTAALLLLVALEMQIAPLAASGAVGDAGYLLLLKVLAPFVAHFAGGLIGGRAYVPVAVLASAAVELTNVRYFARWNGIDPWPMAGEMWMDSLLGVLAAVAGAYLGVRILRTRSTSSRPSLS